MRFSMGFQVDTYGDLAAVLQQEADDWAGALGDTYGEREVISTEAHGDVAGLGHGDIGRWHLTTAEPARRDFWEVPAMRVDYWEAGFMGEDDDHLILANGEQEIAVSGDLGLLAGSIAEIARANGYSVRTDLEPEPAAAEIARKTARAALEQYRKVQRKARKLSERESNGKSVSSSEWERNDDQMRELAGDLAAVLAGVLGETL